MYGERNNFGMQCVFCDGSELACSVVIIDLKDVGGAGVSFCEEGMVRED